MGSTEQTSNVAAIIQEIFSIDLEAEHAENLSSILSFAC
jgi:hypothetical protein